MKQNRTCKYCQKEFIDIDGKIFSNHVRWCDKNVDYDDQAYRNKHKVRMEEKEKLSEKKEEFTKMCKSCNNEFVLKCTPSKFNKSSEYCSRSCANRRVHSEETKNKIKKSINIFNETHQSIYKSKMIESICLNCDIKFSTRKSNKSKCCCGKCAVEYRRKIRNLNDPLGKFKEYRMLCSFRFSLNNFPDEFDFGLVEKFGWYKAKNHGDNLNGVSRDHMISVNYGFKNNISPEIISHPANCALMRHNENVSKHKDCSITLDELNERIFNWEMKYGKFIPSDRKLIRML